LKKLQGPGLAFLSGILLYAAWPVSPFTFLIFIAWIPLLHVAERTTKKLSFFFFSFITTLAWNACTTWWIWNSTDVGAIAAIIANSLLMTLPWWGYFIFKKRYGKRTGYLSLVVFWMMFEYVHLNWQLSWPWLTLGNVFAIHVDWVQWYEYTGTSGGTLWILLINILMFELLTKVRNKRYELRSTTMITTLFIIPFVLSFFIKQNLTNDQTVDTSNDVIIIQPNIDPYNDKFDASTISSQLQTLISLSEKELDSNTRLIVWPETALPDLVSQDALQNTPAYQPVFSFVNNHPNITLVTGVESYKMYGPEKATKTARFDERENSYYDVFNSAVAIKAGSPMEFYDKSKLVPGVETLPDFLLWMGPLFEKFGGTAGGYGRSKESSVFSEKNNPYITAPIICYESIYGEYVASYVKKEANLLTIITNDGWWGNTPGHKQHLAYAKFRAIETRKWIVRSANTGISAVINNKGEIVQTQPWDKAAFIKAIVPVETGETFYVKYGDFLSKIAVALSVLLIVWNIYLLLKNKFTKQKKSSYKFMN
jgi:apolipoprotein N-acyltransferase